MAKLIRFTRHAELRLLTRKIDIVWVIRTAQSPDWCEPEPKDHTVQRRFGYVPEFGNRLLRVVCVETESEIRIVTVTFDRNAEKPE